MKASNLSSEDRQKIAEAIEFLETRGEVTRSETWVLRQLSANGIVRTEEEADLVNKALECYELCTEE